MEADTSRRSCSVCVYKKTPQFVNHSDSIDLLRLLSLLFFFTIKSFVNSCSGPLDLFDSLSLELV